MLLIDLTDGRTRYKRASVSWRMAVLIRARGRSGSFVLKLLSFVTGVPGNG